MRAFATCAILPALCLLAACGPDAGSQYPDGGEPAAAPGDAPPPGPAEQGLNHEVAPDDPIHNAVVASAGLTLTEQIGQPVRIEPEIFRSEGDWAFLYGPIQTADGRPVDWAETNFAAAAAEGMLDGDLGIVLLNWNDGDWRVVETAIAPTDVPQIAWPDEHHVSPELVGLEG